MGWGREQKDSTGQAQDCRQSSVKTCHSWSLHSLLGDWRGMHWSFIPQNRQCSFAPSTLCTTIVSARTLFRRILCPFRFLEVPFQDIHRDPLRSQDQTAVQDQAEVALRWVRFEPVHYRCFSSRIRLLVVERTLMQTSVWCSYIFLYWGLKPSWPLVKISLFSPFFLCDWILPQLRGHNKPFQMLQRADLQCANCGLPPL